MQLSVIVFVCQYNPNCQLKTSVISFIDCFLNLKFLTKSIYYEIVKIIVLHLFNNLFEQQLESAYLISMLGSNSSSS